MEKKKNGRPTKYKPEYCQKMIEYFNIEPNYVSKIITTGKNDYSKEEEKLLPSNLPTFEKFASLLDVNTDTLVEWSKKHKKFSAAYRKCKDLQKNILVANGLTGLYQGNFAIFVATNFTDMRHKNETDITSGGKPVALLGGLSKKNDLEEKEE